MTRPPDTYRVRNSPTLPARRPLRVDERNSAAAQQFEQYGARGQSELAMPYRGITTHGEVRPGLFSIAPTGVSTQPIVDAAEAFLASLDASQQRTALFAVDDIAWRAWSNVHPYVMRHGILLDACSDVQRARALDLVRATSSARGFDLARNVMKLNHALGEITGKVEEYGEWFYWMSIMGRPSAHEPWGWQIDGHHLIVNCFVLADQVVISPTFYGSEPVSVDSGKYAGTRVFDAEEQQGLGLVRGLPREMRELAILPPDTNALRPQRMDGRIQTAAFRDNVELPFAGVPGRALPPNVQSGLLDLIELYVGRMRPGHDRVRMEEVAHHLDQTHFMWVGGLEDDSVFYYRVHSPVILIEFDHLPGVAFDNREPSRNHIHTVMRTPNGNDYGKDLLRQHYALHHRDQQAQAPPL